MSRITIPTLEFVPEASKPLLDGVHKKLGVVPNVFRVAALSPAALEATASASAAHSRRHWTSGPASASRSRSPRRMAAIIVFRRIPTSA